MFLLRGTLVSVPGFFGTRGVSRGVSLSLSHMSLDSDPPHTFFAGHAQDVSRKQSLDGSLVMTKHKMPLDIAKFILI